MPIVRKYPGLASLQSAPGSWLPGGTTFPGILIPLDVLPPPSGTMLIVAVP